MKTKEFNNLEEMQKYYDVRTNTYIFKEDDEFIDLVIFKFDLNLNSNISAKDIVAFGIDVLDIDCLDLNGYEWKKEDLEKSESYQDYLGLVKVIMEWLDRCQIKK